MGIINAELAARRTEVASVLRLSACVVSDSLFISSREMVTIKIIVMRIMCFNSASIRPHYGIITMRMIVTDNFRPFWSFNAVRV